MKWKTPKKLLNKEYVEKHMSIDDYRITEKLIKKIEKAIDKQFGSISMNIDEIQPLEDCGIYTKQFKLKELKNCKIISDICSVYCDIRIDFRDLEIDTEPYVYITIVPIKDEVDKNGIRKWLFNEQWFVSEFDIENETLSELELERI